MNEGERSGFAAIRDCWIGGGAAFALAPPAWREIAGGGATDERERRLLALAGQALAVAFRPAAPKDLVRRSALPRLTLPTLPDPLRPLFRAALKQAASAPMKAKVLALAASRGFAAHPIDWMPAANDLDAPAIYAPWIDWKAEGGKASRLQRDELTAENWDDFFPAARRGHLAALRKADPAAARRLIEAKAPAEAAEARLALVELLRVGLAHDDAPFLKSLSADRSGKVRELAQRLLGRLGQREPGQDEAGLIGELAGLVVQGKAGLIRRRTIFTPVKLKSAAQERRRAEVFEACVLADLAGQFGVGEADIIGGWQFETDRVADALFIHMIAASGSDAAAGLAADALTGGSVELSRLTIHLLPRLDARRQRVFVRKLLFDDTEHVALLTATDGLDPAWLDLDNLSRSPLLKLIKVMIGGTDIEQKRIAADLLPALGFLATAEAARRLLDEATAAGLPLLDSALALLRLNAALTDPPAPTPMEITR